MSSTMLPKDQLKLLHQFVGIIKGNPKILLAPELKFFKDWLERLVHHRNIASFFAIFATLQLHSGPLRMFLPSLNLFGFFFELYPVILNMTWKFLSLTLSFHICYIATSALVWCYLLTEGINLSSQLYISAISDLSFALLSLYFCSTVAWCIILQFLFQAYPCF